MTALTVKLPRDEKFASEIFSHETPARLVALQNAPAAERTKLEADQTLRRFWRRPAATLKRVTKQKHRIKNL